MGLLWLVGLGWRFIVSRPYATTRFPWGGHTDRAHTVLLAGSPAIVISVGVLFLTDTPNSLIMEGTPIGPAPCSSGPDADVDSELWDIAKAVKTAPSVLRRQGGGSDGGHL
ncbi:sugar transport protein 5-like [Panicum miliaceum]|uniref:Sugar transport protein 5-like n=1 Tax=Panicum miliaceum TaxID=4540 RepID=A0A3L6TNA0_PANMI|nr:sugar transport protein 5-like [Panicum miliaceum]